ncbi:MAG TPA: hypothetical protein VLV32_07005, partial [Burkholderiales bacterium]|nr:hypothetical protein [Burkholderiales bacterium]
MPAFAVSGSRPQTTATRAKSIRTPRSCCSYWLPCKSFWGVATTVGFGLGFGLQHQALGIWIGLACGAVV